MLTKKQLFKRIQSLERELGLFFINDKGNDFESHIKDYEYGFKQFVVSIKEELEKLDSAKKK